MVGWLESRDGKKRGKKTVRATRGEESEGRDARWVAKKYKREHEEWLVSLDFALGRVILFAL